MPNARPTKHRNSTRPLASRASTPRERLIDRVLIQWRSSAQRSAARGTRGRTTATG